MNSENYLLDANIVIALFAKEKPVLEKIKSQAPGSISVPSIVIGELFYGAEQSTKKEENKKKIESFANESAIIDCDIITARFYGKIESQLKVKGTPIPENDIWIAAIAQQHDLTLATRDGHFELLNR